MRDEKMSRGRRDRDSGGADSGSAKDDLYKGNLDWRVEAGELQLERRGWRVGTVERWLDSGGVEAGEWKIGCWRREGGE